MHHPRIAADLIGFYIFAININIIDMIKNFKILDMQ